MALLNDLTIQQILSRIAATLLFMGLHGFCLAGFARLFGDRRPALEGRLTPNPFAHFNLPALLMAVLFRTAWILPMRIDPSRTHGRLGLVAVAILALAATLLAVPAIDLLRPLAATHLPQSFGYVVLQILVEMQMVVTVSVILNLLPVPVLTGGLFLVALRPGLAPRLRKAQPLVTAMLVIVLVAGWWPDFAPLTARLSSID